MKSESWLPELPGRKNKRIEKLRVKLKRSLNDKVSFDCRKW